MNTSKDRGNSTDPNPAPDLAAVRACPFCGAPPVIYDLKRADGGFVKCSTVTCVVRQPISVNEWNTRPLEAALAERVEAAERSRDDWRRRWDRQDAEITGLNNEFVALRAQLASHRALEEAARLVVEAFDKALYDGNAIDGTGRSPLATLRAALAQPRAEDGE